MLYENVDAGNVRESCWNVVLCSAIDIYPVRKFDTLWHFDIVWQTINWNLSSPLEKKQNIFQSMNHALHTYKHIYDKFILTKDFTLDETDQLLSNSLTKMTLKIWFSRRLGLKFLETYWPF